MGCVGWPPFGTLFDIPDTEANARVFGYPGTRKGTHAAFPKARLVLLVELGTHLITDALISPYKIGERVRAIKLLRSVGEGMLLTWDRGLHSFKMVKAALDQKCHILGRIPANVKFEVQSVRRCWYFTFTPRIYWQFTCAASRYSSVSTGLKPYASSVCQLVNVRDFRARDSP